MEPSLYKAAMEGKVDGLVQHIDQLDVQVTPNGNTVLHVAAQFGHFPCVEKILGKCPMLLNQVNIKGETPLHIAAREGDSHIVKALIETAKELDLESGGGAAKALLRATNLIDNDTALHMAVRSRHYNLEVVKLLTSEDPEFQHPPNNAEETPLYLAAERRYDDVVSEILETCTSPAYGGPGGRTALHAAAISRSTVSMKKLLDWKQDLIKEADAHGWTPIHYATRRGNVMGVRLLLETDKSVAYITTTEENNDKKTALHIAVTVGAVSVMEEILTHCPDSWEMVNSKGQNALHIAVAMQEIDAIIFMLKQSWSSHLINQKDHIEGNTPLHLLGYDSYLRLEVPELWVHVEADRGAAFNNKNLTPDDVRMSAYYEDHFLEWSVGGGRNIVNNDRQMLSNIVKWKRASREQREEAQKEAEKELKGRKKAATENEKKIGDTHLIVATLIATVTFAASFTLPGGYDSNAGAEQGMAVLIREAAFKAFVITNTIAVICSTSSAFLYVTASIYYGEDDEDVYENMGNRHAAAFLLILIAMGAMMIAFVTGAYAVLAHSLGLAISTCVLGCVSFLLYYFELKNLVGNLK